LHRQLAIFSTVVNRYVLAAVLWLLLPAAPSLARSRLHLWTDKDGVVHVEDTPAPARGSAAALSSGKRAPRARPASPPKHPARWWERATDAPPDQIDRAAELYNIPAELVRAVIAVESAGDAAAVSHKGAVGLMQLMPVTAGQMYVEDAVDPAQNILGGTRYLRHLANQFHGDMLLTLAAYNAGPEAVRKYGGVPPFEETRQYVRKVVAYYQQLKREAARSSKKLASAADPRPAAAEPPGETQR
jgi:soluble lytic murein transglycosylase-like protein